MATTTSATSGGGAGAARRTTGGDWAFYAVLLSLFILGSFYAFNHDGGHDLNEKEGGFAPPFNAIGILVAAGFTLALYSYLYKDNAFFKAAENLYVGVGLGYELLIIWFDYLKPDLYKPLVRYWVRGDTVPGRPDWMLVVPLILGLLLLSRFVPKISWLSRWSFAFIVGFGAGTVIPNNIQAFVLQQLQQTVVPLAPVGEGAARWIGPAQTLLVLTGVVTVLLYFFFSIEHRGAVGAASKLGIWFLMISFGASFGYTVMGRMALLVQRIEFLLFEWLKMPLPT
jgi:hypothetical protein